MGDYGEMMSQLVSVTITGHQVARYLSELIEVQVNRKELWSNLVYRAKQRLLLMLPPLVCHLGTSRC